MASGKGRVAWAGLGEMGLPMARRLVEAGFEVAGFDPRAERARDLIQAGGRAAQSPKEAASGADVVVLIPFDAEQQRRSLLDADGALAALDPGGLVVAMATIGPAAMRALAAEVAERGFQMVDAPVTGGVARAVDGTLTVIASGAAAALDRAEPVLGPLSRTVFRVGDAPGAAQFVKLINQLMVYSHLAVAAEAMAMGAAAGVDLQQLYDLLTTGAGRSEIFVSRAGAVVDGSMKTGGTLQIAQKDFPLVLETARELGVPLATGSAAFQLVQWARTLGIGDRDDAYLIKMLMDPPSFARPA